MGLKELIDNYKSKKEIEKIEKSKWEKISPNFLISKEYQKIKIKGKDIPFNKILGVKLVEDYKTITKTTGKNKAKGKNKKHIAPVKAIVGGALFGPVGAVIGGSSGKTTTKSKTVVNTITEDEEYCIKLSLNIEVDDYSEPIIVYNLITSSTLKNGFIYNTSYSNAQKCIVIINNIINSKK